MTKNLFLAHQFCERLIANKSLGIPFAQELKNSVENALNQYKTSSDLFAIIPGGNKYNTIFKYLFPLIFPEKALPQNLKLIFDECFDISHIHHTLCIESLIMITGTWDTNLFETGNHLYFHGMDFTKMENLLDKSFARRLALFLQ